MPKGIVPGRPGRLRQFLAVRFAPGKTARLLVLDEQDEPVSGAGVLVAGLNQTKTNRKGVARFYLPGPDTYAVAVTVNGCEEVLYEESMTPGRSYVYRPDPEQSEGRYFVLTEE